VPRGPKGEKRPANVIGNAVHVMWIATGEIGEDRGKTPNRAKGGKEGCPPSALVGQIGQIEEGSVSGSS
jgi:hypothetical protein